VIHKQFALIPLFIHYCDQFFLVVLKEHLKVTIFLCDNAAAFAHIFILGYHFP
jgi:hypothetical protein